MRIIRYVNPEKMTNGQFRCVICRRVFDSFDRARRCAQADHRRIKKLRETLAAHSKGE